MYNVRSEDLTVVAMKSVDSGNVTQCNLVMFTDVLEECNASILSSGRAVLLALLAFRCLNSSYTVFKVLHLY
jgi:hypothetical protein